MSAPLIAGLAVAGAVLAMARPRLGAASVPRLVRLVGERPSVGRPFTDASVRFPVFVGARLRGLLGRRPDPTADRLAGIALLVGLLLAVAHPVLGMGAAALVVGRPWLERRRAVRLRERAARDAVPDVIDLFRFAAAAGLNVRLAVDAVVARLHGPPRDALDEVRRRVALGERLADTLAEALPDVGEAFRPLASVLVHADRDGVPLAASLDRLADDARLERRRAAEEDARRLPVRLLFPLVCCILPAFVLLTVVPLLAGSFRSLPL